MEKVLHMKKLIEIKNILLEAGVTPEKLIFDFNDPEFIALNMSANLLSYIKGVVQFWDIIPHEIEKTT